MTREITFRHRKIAKPRPGTIPAILQTILFSATYEEAPILYNVLSPTERTPGMAHLVKCVKYGKEMEGLDEPPFDTPFGQKIYDNVSKQAWAAWLEHMKMLLNEYRLQPWKPEAQEFLVEQMNAYFFGEGAKLPDQYVPQDEGQKSNPGSQS